MFWLKIKNKFKRVQNATNFANHFYVLL